MLVAADPSSPNPLPPAGGKGARWLLDWRAFAAVSTILTIIGYLGWGFEAAAGFLLGLVGVGGNTLALWLVVRTLSNAAKEGAQPRYGPTLTILALLVKLPLVIGTMVLCWRLGWTGIDWYLFALTLVYSRLIGQILPLG